MGGKDVAIIDFVKPSPLGTKWDIGGTCVNVGCIPKKLMHFAALMKQNMINANSYGWDIDGKSIKHDWETLANAVQMHVRSLNWGYKVQLAGKSIQYINGYGKFLDKNKVTVTNRRGKTTVIESENIVVAVGLRPKFPNVPGAKELCMSSDDIFWKKESPGKTLVIGGSYVGLECAGFLHGLNLDATVMIRSIPLRGFDMQMAKLVTDYMEEEGIKIQWSRSPVSFTRTDSGKIRVDSKSTEGETFSEEFDSVLIATGREPAIDDMGLEQAGILRNSSTGKIIVNSLEETNVDGVFAIGDVAQDRPELTPVAIKSGKMLAERLFSDSNTPMVYENIPTTVFTPLEYSCIGLSEDEATEKLGAENIEIYHCFYRPLEFAIPNQNSEQCFIKLVCSLDKNTPILGLHFLGPSAGEVMQGFSCAFSAGLTYNQLMNNVGIHPTSAEEFVKMNITKRSGADPKVTGC